MPLIEIVRLTVAAIATVILAGAAASDIRWRRIPNWCVLALLALFLPWALTGGWPAALSALEAATIALAVTFALYALGVFGAGDSKLFAACALFAGMELLPYLVLATSLVGGLIALVAIASRPRRALVMFQMRGKGDFGRGIPYGVAVSAAAAIIIWAPLAGLPLAGLLRNPQLHPSSRAVATPGSSPTTTFTHPALHGRRFLITAVIPAATDPGLEPGGVKSRDPGDRAGHCGSRTPEPLPVTWVPHLRSTAFRFVRDDGAIWKVWMCESDSGPSPRFVPPGMTDEVANFTATPARHA